jgi:hypothetical protein
MGIAERIDDAADLTAPESPALLGAANRLGRPLFVTAIVALWLYLGTALLYQRQIGPLHIGAAKLVVLLAAGVVVLMGGTARLARRGALSPSRMLELGAAGISLLVATLVADVGYTMYDNVRRARAEAPISNEARATDANVWHGELLPRLYFPTTKTFALYKPNVRLTANTYGEFYTPAMLASRILVDSVLEPRRITYAIGPHGVRATTPLARSRIFALGDSYALGYATDEGKVWTDRLGASLGEPVYNLGVSSTGPRAHVDLLEYMLAAHHDSMRVERLLWMIYEGNDLENSYAGRREPEAPTGLGLGGMLQGTVVQSFGSLPARVRSQSVLRRLIDGDLTFGSLQASSRGGRYEIDGVSLPVPLYHSRRWGYRLFNPDDVFGASVPREYVMRHPNRPLLEQTMRDMRALSERYGFKVTVIIAPTDARLYGADFEGMPAPSATSYFADFVADQARSLGFDVTNLVTLLRPFARSEMLYYRDDHHWNARGNEVAAQVIGASLAGQNASPARGATAP